MAAQRESTIVVIAGAPGAGKSTVAAALQVALSCPLFEFGWIPEFRDTGARELPYIEEEAMAFENLVLVAKNYVAHGFQWVILTDLQAPYVARVHDVFDGYHHRTFTLRQADEDLLRERVLTESRSSGYRDHDTAVTRNADLYRRPAHPGEQFVEVGIRPVEDVVHDILAHLNIQPAKGRDGT